MRTALTVLQRGLDDIIFAPSGWRIFFTCLALTIIVIAIASPAALPIERLAPSPARQWWAQATLWILSYLVLAAGAHALPGASPLPAADWIAYTQAPPAVVAAGQTLCAWFIGWFWLMVSAPLGWVAGLAGPPGMNWGALALYAGLYSLALAAWGVWLQLAVRQASMRAALIHLYLFGLLVTLIFAAEGGTLPRVPAEFHPPTAAHRIAGGETALYGASRTVWDATFKSGFAEGAWSRIIVAHLAMASAGFALAARRLSHLRLARQATEKEAERHGAP